MSSTSEQESSGTTVQSKLDIEVFRQHLLNYRSKPDDSELDSSYQLDLDSSFKRMLDEKRQMTNKENDPSAVPPSAILAPEPSTSVNPVEKPLRRDLLKERLLHRINDDSLNLDNSASYICENSISTDIEYATINRLMADFNINRDSTIGQKRSPLKSLRITGDVSTDDDAFMPGVRRLQSPRFETRRGETPSRAEQPKQESAPVNADDTLEEIEYVLDRGLNYVPKRLILKENEMKQEREQEQEQEQFTHENDENDENAPIDLSESIDKDKSVIVIESSPENSFTQNTGLFKSALESIDNTFYTAKTNQNTKSMCSISIGDESLSNRDKKSNSSDDDATLEDKSFGPSSCNTSRNHSELFDFNDSLERVEFMMRQGEKMMNRQATPAAKLTQHKPNSISKNHESKTPTTRTPIGGAIKKILPLSSGKKQIGRVATPNKNDLFKRPVRSPQVQPQTRIPTKSKIPTAQHSVVSSLANPQFRHIASPIAAYIKNTPKVPLMKTIKPFKDLMTSEVYQKFDNKALDETTQSVESFPTKSALPRKMYISAPQRQIIDHRYIVTPGGKSVKKLIGNAPLVIRHDGKIKSHDHVAHIPFEESLADLSVASGDISVQVVKDVHRK